MSEDKFEIKCPKCSAINCHIAMVVSSYISPIIGLTSDIGMRTELNITCGSCGYALQINNAKPHIANWGKNDE